MFKAAPYSVSGPGVRLVKVNYDRAIRVAHVSQRAFLVPAVLQFFQRITIRNFARCIQTPGRTPTATLDPMFERNVECRAIHSSLSAGNNLQDVDLILW